MLRSFYTLFALLVSIGLLVLNGRLWWPTGTAYLSARGGPDVVAQLRFGRSALDGGEAERMQGLFPEGYFFSYVLYGLTWVEVGLREPPGTPHHVEALREARWALAHLDTPAGRAPFPPDLVPPFGVFYRGWSNWLRGGILLLQPAATRDPAEVARFGAECEALAAAFEGSATPFLPSYTGQAWPVDSVVAVATLRLHDTLLPPRYGATVTHWLEEAKARLDPATRLLPHRTDPRTGALLEGARGSSGSLIARFLVEVEPAWGRAQYARFREEFVTTRLGVPGVREFPLGVAGTGDVDSGPLFWDVSLSATAVMLGAAQVHGDRALGDPLRHAAETLGLPMTWRGVKRYAGGALPIGDAFLAWAKSAHPWTVAPEATTLPPVAAWWWRLPWHTVSAGVLVLLWWPVWLQRARGRTGMRGARR